VNTVVSAEALVHEVVGVRLNRGHSGEMRLGRRLPVLNREVAGIVALRAPHQLVQQEEQGFLLAGASWSLAALVPHKLDHIPKADFVLRVFRRDVAMKCAELPAIGAVTLPSGVFESKVDHSGFVRWRYSRRSVEVLRLCHMGSDKALSIQHQLRTIC